MLLCRHGYRKISASADGGPKQIIRGSETSGMIFEGLGEMFEGYSGDMGGEKFPLVLIGGGAEGIACADPGARTPIGTSGNFHIKAGLYTVYKKTWSYLIGHFFFLSAETFISF